MILRACWIAALLLFEAVVSQTITVTSPAAGDLVPCGFLANITWTSTGLPNSEPIGIEIWDSTSWLSIGGFNVGPMSNNFVASFQTVNDGLFQFWAPVMSSNTSYYVVVYDLNNRQTYGQSQMFTIVVLQQSIAVTEPDPSMTLLTGDTITVAWTANNIPSDAAMQINLKQQSASSLLAMVQSWLSIYSFTPITTVVANMSNSGSYTWDVPLWLNPGAGYVFDVIWLANGLTGSSAPISAVAGAQSLSVTLPSANATWYLSGTEKTVGWSASGIAGAFDIALYVVVNGASSLQSVLAHGVSGSLAYVTLPSGVGAGSYFVRVSSDSMPNYYADSSPFIIVSATGGTGGIAVGNIKNALSMDLLTSSACRAQLCVAAILATHFSL